LKSELWLRAGVLWKNSKAKPWATGYGALEQVSRKKIQPVGHNLEDRDRHKECLIA